MKLRTRAAVDEEIAIAEGRFEGISGFDSGLARFARAQWGQSASRCHVATQRKPIETGGLQSPDRIAVVGHRPVPVRQVSREKILIPSWRETVLAVLARDQHSLPLCPS